MILNSMVNNIDMNSVKYMSKAFEGTSDGLNGIIEALRSHLPPEPPPPPPNPKTVVTYQNGDIVEYLIEGELGENSIPNKFDAINIKIGTDVTSLKSNSLSGCSDLTSVTIPTSLVSCGVAAFAECTNLTKVNISNLESWVSIKYDNKYANPCHNGAHLFLKNKEIIDLLIPNSITIITNIVFCGCKYITSVTIPDSVISVYNYAFYDCKGLNKIEIGRNVDKIGSYVFSNCENLSSITCLATTAPTVYQYTFGTNTSNYAGRNSYQFGTNVLKVPQGATEYNSSYWANTLCNAEKCGFHIETI